MHKKDIVRYLICFIIIICTMFSISTAYAADWTTYVSIFPFKPSNAKAVILADVSTGEILWAQNEDKTLPPASTVKVMTVLMVLEAVSRGSASLDDMVTVTEEMISSLPSDASTMLIPIEDGESISVRDLLYATMVVSDCRASNVLAYYISGSIDKFAKLMNDRAAELGCTDTIFTNPSGYPDDIMHTTARSFYLIIAEAMKYDLYFDLASTTEYTISPTNLNGPRTLHNYNLLLIHPEVTEEDIFPDDYYYPYTTGSKTGFSTPSGPCLVSTAEKDGIQLAAVVFGGENIEDSNGTVISNRYIDTIRMFEYGFSLLGGREIRSVMATERISSIAQNHEYGLLCYTDALSKESEIRSSFDALAAHENHSRTSMVIFSSAAALCIIVVFVIISVLKKRRHRTSV